MTVYPLGTVKDLRLDRVLPGTNYLILLVSPHRVVNTLWERFTYNKVTFPPGGTPNRVLTWSLLNMVYCVQLACVRPALCVHSEPESNSNVLGVTTRVASYRG